MTANSRTVLRTLVHEFGTGNRSEQLLESLKEETYFVIPPGEEEPMDLPEGQIRFYGKYRQLDPADAEAIFDEMELILGLAGPLPHRAKPADLICRTHWNTFSDCICHAQFRWDSHGPSILARVHGDLPGLNLDEEDLEFLCAYWNSRNSYTKASVYRPWGGSGMGRLELRAHFIPPERTDGSELPDWSTVMMMEQFWKRSEGFWRFARMVNGQ